MSEIIERPEGWEDMVAKYKERQKEGLDKALAKRKASNEEDLIKTAGAAIAKRALRKGDEKPLKDKTVLKEPKDPAVKEMRANLAASVTGVAQKVFGGSEDTAAPAA